MLQILNRDLNEWLGMFEDLLGEEVLTRNRMIKVSDAYSLEDLCDMEEDDMAALLGFYAPDEVPTLKQLRGTKEVKEEEEVEEFNGFDGSFGFFVGWG